MKSEKSIPLFYWSSKRFENKVKENYGDLLSKYLVEKISGCNVNWVHPKKQSIFKLNKKNFLAIGSIINHATKSSTVWGSGIIDTKYKVSRAKFEAVRGPQTREFLIKSGYTCPEIYGDPALLLPQYYMPEIKKEFSLGIIPHYVDYNKINQIYQNDNNIKVIDLMTNDIESTTKEILSCNKIISSSLHGVIVSHSYSIPAVWVRFSNKVAGNNIKYRDYFESVDVTPYEGKLISEKQSLESFLNLIEEYPNAIPEGKLHKIQKGLIASCPFIKH